MSTTSAVPSLLERFAHQSHSAHETLRSRRSELGAALDALRDSRSSGVGTVPAFDEDMADLLRRSDEIGHRVFAIAASLREADSGSLGGPWERVPVRASDQQIERSIRLQELRQRAATFPAGRPFELMTLLTPMPQDKWRDAVYGASCPPFAAGAHYGGGGALRGPDGRDYPIVIPTLQIDDTEYHADHLLGPGQGSVTTLGGSDKGWVTLGVVQGVASRRPAASGPERFAVFWAGTNPQVEPQRRPVPERAYEDLQVSSNGWPTLGVGAPGSPSGPPPAPSSLSQPRSPAFVMIDGQLVEHDRMQPGDHSREVRRSGLVAPNARAESAGRGMAGVDLATNLLEGVSLVQDYENSRHFGYQAVFDEHLDGRTRAMIRTYDVAVTPESKVQIAPGSIHLEGAEPQYTPLRFRQWNPAFERADKPSEVVRW